MISYQAVSFPHLKTTGCFIHNHGVGFKLYKIYLWYQKQPVGIILNKTRLILVNYPVVIFPHLIRNTRLDLNCVKSTCGTRKTAVSSWNKAPLVLMNYLVVIFSHFKKPLVVLSITLGLDLNCVKSTYSTKKQPVRIIWNKTSLVLMDYLVIIFLTLKKPLIVLSITQDWI